MSAKILVTGATGTVGRVVVRDLVQKGKDVRAGLHTAEKLEYIKMSGVEPVALEFGDFATIDKALQDIETLILITPFAREEVEFAKRMVDRARMWGVEHIIKLSMLNADDFPGTQFSRWHRQAEHYIEQSGLPYTFIRPNAYMQNFLRYVQPSGSFITMPLDGAQVSYIDVRDIGGVITEVVFGKKDFFEKTLDLTGPFALSADDVADILTKQIGYHIGYISISSELAMHVLESLGTPIWMAEGMLEQYAMQRSNKNRRLTSTVEEILNRVPIPFDMFVHDHAELFKAIVQHEHSTHF